VCAALGAGADARGAKPDGQDGRGGIAGGVVLTERFVLPVRELPPGAENGGAEPVAWDRHTGDGFA